MGTEGVEDQRRHTAVTSQNGCLETWSKSRGKHGIALDGEDWYDVLHEQLIITRDGTAKEVEIITMLSFERNMSTPCQVAFLTGKENTQNIKLVDPEMVVVLHSPSVCPQARLPTCPFALPPEKRLSSLISGQTPIHLVYCQCLITMTFCR